MYSRPNLASIPSRDVVVEVFSIFEELAEGKDFAGIPVADMAILLNRCILIFEPLPGLE